MFELIEIIIFWNFKFICFNIEIESIPCLILLLKLLHWQINSILEILKERLFIYQINKIYFISPIHKRCANRHSISVPFHHIWKVLSLFQYREDEWRLTHYQMLIFLILNFPLYLPLCVFDNFLCQFFT